MVATSSWSSTSSTEAMGMGANGDQANGLLGGSSSDSSETVGGDQDGPLWSAASDCWRCTRPRYQRSVEDVTLEGLPLRFVPCLCSSLCGPSRGTTSRQSTMRRRSGVCTVVGITWCPRCTDGTWLAWGQGLTTFPRHFAAGWTTAQARSCSQWKGKEKRDYEQLNDIKDTWYLFFCLVSGRGVSNNIGTSPTEAEENDLVVELERSVSEALRQAWEFSWEKIWKPNGAGIG